MRSVASMVAMSSRLFAVNGRMVPGSQRSGEGPVKVHVDAAVAGRRSVGDVGGKRFVTLCGARNAALKRQLGGIDQHEGTVLLEGRGGGPSVSLKALHPWCALPVSASRAEAFRVQTRLSKTTRRSGS